MLKHCATHTFLLSILSDCSCQSGMRTTNMQWWKSWCCRYKLWFGAWTPQLKQKLKLFCFCEEWNVGSYLKLWSESLLSDACKILKLWWLWSNSICHASASIASTEMTFQLGLTVQQIYFLSQRACLPASCLSWNRLKLDISDKSARSLSTLR